jgi:hypothetical protein
MSDHSPWRHARASAAGAVIEEAGAKTTAAISLLTVRRPRLGPPAAGVCGTTNLKFTGLTQKLGQL